MTEASNCLSAGRLAQASPSPGSDVDLMTRGATLRWSLRDWLFAHMPAGWSGKMSPAYSRATAEAILPRSFLSSQDGKSGFQTEAGGIPESSPAVQDASAWVGECLTLNTPESNNFRGASRSDGDVLSLSDILEDANVSPEYYLTANCVRAILRRAEERGEPLPAKIESACRSILRIWTAG